MRAKVVGNLATVARRLSQVWLYQKCSPRLLPVSTSQTPSVLHPIRFETIACQFIESDSTGWEICCLHAIRITNADAALTS